MPVPLSGKVALITGGSSGIGLETARLLARRGVRVWLVARSKDRLDTARALIDASPDATLCGAISADVTRPDEASRAVAEVTRAAGRAPDLLVNSAGAVYPGLFSDTGPAVARSLMEVNYFGTVNTTHACLPGMLARRSGHIVNISSVYGFLGGYAYAGYCASKFAIRGFSDSLRAELKPAGIHVSVVFPQNTATPQLEYEEKLQPAVVKELDTTRVMTPQAVAGAIVRGIERQRYIIIPGAEGRLYFALSAIPWLTAFVMDRLVSTALRKLEKGGKPHDGHL